jgi:hypothetical protein
MKKKKKKKKNDEGKRKRKHGSAPMWSSSPDLPVKG